MAVRKKYSLSDSHFFCSNIKGRSRLQATGQALRGYGFRLRPNASHLFAYGTASILNASI